MEYTLRASSRIIKSIGKELIADKIASVVELVKNSYDADAAEVKIKILKDSIYIEDNGVGMSLDTVLNAWLIPATDNKEKNKITKKSRRVLGSKGLGRYSVGILGDFLELVTVSNNEKTTLKINWTDFDKVQFLEDVKINVLTEKTKEKDGTLLKINKLSKSWSPQENEKLKKELKLLISPFKNKNEDLFEIKLFNEKEKILETLEPYAALIEGFHYRIHGLIHLSENIINIQFQTQKTESIIKDLSELNEIKNINFLEKLEFDFKVFDRDSESLKNVYNENSLTLSNIKSILDEVCGLKIYRENFRIRPYGDKENDWLDLNRERVQNPTQRLSVNQIVGSIYIEDNDTSLLKEKSARDGLQEEEEFYKFKKLIIYIVRLLENRRTSIRKNLQKKIDKTITEKLTEVSSYKKLETEIIKKLDGAGLTENKLDEISQIIYKKEEENHKIIKEIERRFAIYERQITLGKLTEVLMHESAKYLTVLKNNPRYLLMELEKQINIIKKEEYINLKKLSQEIQKYSLMLQNLFSKIRPLSRRSVIKKEFDLEKCINTSLMPFNSDILKYDIIVTYDILEKTIYGCEEDFITVFTNLFDNSIYWMKDSKIKNLDIKSYKKNGKVIIEVKDTGVGLSEEQLENNVIFEPGISYKDDGTGLGLPISGEALKRNIFVLKAISCNNGAHFIMEEEK